MWKGFFPNALLLTFSLLYFSLFSFFINFFFQFQDAREVKKCWNFISFLSRCFIALFCVSPTTTRFFFSPFRLRLFHIENHTKNLINSLKREMKRKLNFIFLIFFFLYFTTPTVIIIISGLMQRAKNDKAAKASKWLLRWLHRCTVKYQKRAKELKH